MLIYPIIRAGLLWRTMKISLKIGGSGSEIQAGKLYYSPLDEVL
jgi:hypothetical protein